ncbi:MAG: hypothetical protein IJ397_00305 [Lachnospiraceae bacterium]|nr:hypothetical protein [Lachnospiraceae bacterium]
MKALLCNKTHFFSHKKIENRKELDYDIVDGMCENLRRMSFKYKRGLVFFWEHCGQ